MKQLIKRIIFWTVFAAMLACALPWAGVAVGQSLYEANPGQARTVWTITSFISVYERDRVLYDIGNAAYKQREFDAAVQSYQQADAVAEPDHVCMIRYNWGLSLSAKGDGLVTSDPDQARAQYAEALRVIAINKCQNDPQYKDAFQALYNDLLEKIRRLSGKSAQQTQGSSQQKTSEEIVKDNQEEIDQTQSYQNQRRFDENLNGGSESAGNFVW